jgi:hypothetical protein
MQTSFTSELLSLLIFIIVFVVIGFLYNQWKILKEKSGHLHLLKRNLDSTGYFLLNSTYEFAFSQAEAYYHFVEKITINDNKAISAFTYTNTGEKIKLLWEFSKVKTSTHWALSDAEFQTRCTAFHLISRKECILEFLKLHTEKYTQSDIKYYYDFPNWALGSKDLLAISITHVEKVDKSILNETEIHKEKKQSPPTMSNRMSEDLEKLAQSYGLVIDKDTPSNISRNWSTRFVSVSDQTIQEK